MAKVLNKETGESETVSAGGAEAMVQNNPDKYEVIGKSEEPPEIEKLGEDTEPEGDSDFSLEVQESKKLEPGLHKGVITKMEKRTAMNGKATYLDITAEVEKDDSKIELSAGYPANISENSMLGKLLQRFGAELKVGVSMDPRKILMQRTCEFQVKTNENGYSDILRDTVKPVGEG